MTNTDPDAGETRPWERWGAARRDCAPQRGNALRTTAEADPEPERAGGVCALGFRGGVRGAYSLP
jgi:hypothetical protein